MDLQKEIGANIRDLRKRRGIRINELARAISKSSATVSKYENGLIALDIQTMYEIAAALKVPPERLLYSPPIEAEDLTSDDVPAFFRGFNRFYLYFYDGRDNSVVRSILDIRNQVGPGVYDAMLYMNFADYDHYRNCEITYTGTLSHFDAISNLVVQNPDSAMDIYLISIPSTYLNAESKWGQDFGISGRPIMPTSNKVFISKTIQKETSEFIRDLHVSKEDIRLLKQYNMLVVL